VPVRMMILEDVMRAEAFFDIWPTILKEKLAAEAPDPIWG
jgi:hypothetical protein